MTNYFSLPPHSKECAMGGETFDRLEHAISALVEERGKRVRKDYCPNCFSKLPAVVSYWEIKPKRRKKRATPDSLFSYFKTLFFERKEDNKALLFGLALFLERARLLSRKKNAEKIEWMHSKSKECFEMTPQTLSDEILMQLREIVSNERAS